VGYAPGWAAPASTVVIGLGAGGFASSIGPLVLGSAPREYAARVQALAALAQVLPVLVTNAVLGYLADLAGARPVDALVCCGHDRGGSRSRPAPGSCGVPGSPGS
jgi:hypothetical protein